MYIDFYKKLCSNWQLLKLDFLLFLCFEIGIASFTANIATINSSLGMLVASRGVTFVLAVTSLLYYSPFLYFTFKYATAAYASFEASLKTCNETSCYSKFICKHLRTFISEICSNSLHQAMNLYFRSSRESFHSSPCNHNSCIIIFPHMIFGAKNPNGLNRVAILVRTILLVMLSFSSLFDTVNVNWSFCGWTGHFVATTALQESWLLVSAFPIFLSPLLSLHMVSAPKLLFN